MTGRTRVLLQARKHPMLPASHCQMLGKTTSVEKTSWCITVKSSGAGIKRTMFKRNARALQTGMELTSAGTFKMDGSGETNMSMQTERETIQGLQV